MRNKDESVRNVHYELRIRQDLIKASKMVTVSGLTTLNCHPTDLFLYLRRAHIWELPQP